MYNSKGIGFDDFGVASVVKGVGAGDGLFLGKLFVEFDHNDAKFFAGDGFFKIFHDVGIGKPIAIGHFKLRHSPTAGRGINFDGLGFGMG